MRSGNAEREQETPAVESKNQGLHSLATRWAESGAMWLTGRCDGPALGCPTGVVAVLDAASQHLAEHSRGFLGTEVSVDGLALLGERAALSTLSRRGSTSCGGATRILQTADGHLALSLARPDDVALLPALLSESAITLDRATSNSLFVHGQPNDAIWSLLAQIFRQCTAHELEERGVALGLAIAVLPRRVSPDRPQRFVESNHALSTTDQAQFRLQQAVLRSPRSGTGLTRRAANTRRTVRVVDLSSLWAGPLCGQLLASAGCEVIKVESTQRPDGARKGSPELFTLLNGQKQSVALDFTKNEDLRALTDLLAGADVVLEASRPRALEQLGINRESLLSASTISVWLQITGHGATGPDANRIGFGDDAAVAAGLVAWDGDQPMFCADAIADPATGLIAASAVIEALSTNQQSPNQQGTNQQGINQRWLLDVSLRRVAEAMMWGPTLRWAGDVAIPRARGVKHQLQRGYLP